MNTLGYQLKGLGSLLNNLTNEETNTQKTTNTVSPKMKISIRDLEHISDALLCYTKHLARKQDYDKMKFVKALDQRIFSTLEQLSGESEVVPS